VHCVADCIRDCIWFAVPEPAEWQRSGNQINAAMIFALSDFIDVRRSPAV